MAATGQGIDSSCGLTLAVFLGKELFLPSLAELAEPSGKRKPYTLWMAGSSRGNIALDGILSHIIRESVQDVTTTQFIDTKIKFHVSSSKYNVRLSTKFDRFVVVKKFCHQVGVPTIASSNWSYKVGNFSFKAQVLRKFKNYKRSCISLMEISRCTHLILLSPCLRDQFI